MAEPTAREKLLITKFRNNVMDILETEQKQSAPFLIRWIRARDHDLLKAELMLRNAIKLRNEINLDSLKTRKFDEFFPKNFPHYLDGFDKEGHPVVTYEFGKWDLKRTAELGLLDEFTNYYMAQLEHAVELASKIKKENSDWPVSQIAAVINCEGYSYSQLFATRSSLSLIVRKVRQFELLYPETMFHGIFINCSKVLYMFHVLTKMWIPPKTRIKIHHYGTNREEWEPIVHALIDPSQIRRQFGGTRDDLA